MKIVLEGEQGVVLNSEQRRAVDLVSSGKNVFITGSGGTGKSFLLQQIRKSCNKNLAVTATTGVAAVNVKGQTLHSFFGVGLANGPVSHLVKKMQWKAKDRIRTVETLVVDEVSMLSRKLFEKFEEISRAIRKNCKFFGGIQIVFIGDFAQLPPVEKDKEPEFCFESDQWRGGAIEVVSLQTIYRQKDENFVETLNRVRFGQVSSEDEAFIRSCKYDKKSHSDNINPVVLYATNREADKMNQEKLKSLKTDPVFFEMIRSGDTKRAERLAKNTGADESLELRVGAQVMVIANVDTANGVVNGSLGAIVDIVNGLPKVRLSNGMERVISRHTWEAHEYNAQTDSTDILARVTQIPLKYAWAQTVHKSQSQQFDLVYVDFARFFAEGQAYVALSRAKTPEGLFTENFSKNVVGVNKKVLDFYNGLQKMVSSDTVL